MGVFENAFKRELGKNTAKTASNFLFGDKWSTPYRRIDARGGAGESAAEARERRTTARIGIEEQDYINSVDRAVLSNVDAVIAIEFSESPREMVRQISDLLVQVKSNSFKATTKEEKVRTKYTLAVLSKIEQGINILEQEDPNNPQLNYLTWQYLKASWRKIFTIRSTWKDTMSKHDTIQVLVLLFGMVSIGVLLGFIVWASEGNIDDDAWARMLLFAILFLFGIYVLKFILLGVAFGYHKIKRNIISKRLLTEQQYYKSQESNVIPSAEPVVSKVEVPEPTKPSAPAYHIVDLNENDFLDEALRNIWKTYRSKGNKAIMSRKPMFASEAILGSVLYVGINPSFNPIDDNVMPCTNSSSALYYGSSYRDPKAPSYFKNLEYFADQCGLPYTQINLLYARENDRGLLLQSNPDFIREQLELTYKLIGMIKPKVILFFTSMCKDLIYGADRWVNPRSNRDGVYTLNGTNIPVIFCEDITTLDNIEQQKLVRQIKFL